MGSPGEGGWVGAVEILFSVNDASRAVFYLKKGIIDHFSDPNEECYEGSVNIRL